MKKILLVGSHLGYNLEYFVKHGLIMLGNPVEFVGYQQTKRTSSWFRMLITRSYYFRKIFAKKNMDDFLNQITITIKKFEPDILLSIKGEMLDGKSVEYLRKEYGVKTALWFPDDPRYFHSLVSHIAPYYDYVFTKSEIMIPKYEKINSKKVNVVPFGCDPTIHKLNQSQHRNLDISFIGSYTFRRSHILGALQDKGLHVYGPYWNIFHPRRKYHPPVWGKCVTDLLNKSKIGLNIHAKSDLDVAPNMRTFEIPACGALMLTDKPRGIEKYYEVGKEIICYESIKELKELIDFFIGTPEELYKISKRGYDRTIADHTYEKRMKLILSIIK